MDIKLLGIDKEGVTEPRNDGNTRIGSLLGSFPTIRSAVNAVVEIIH